MWKTWKIAKVTLENLLFSLIWKYLHGHSPFNLGNCLYLDALFFKCHFTIAKSVLLVWNSFPFFGLEFLSFSLLQPFLSYRSALLFGWNFLSNLVCLPINRDSFICSKNPWLRPLRPPSQVIPVFSGHVID